MNQIATIDINSKYFNTLSAMCPQPPNQDARELLHDQINEIRRLKREKNAVILSHYYMPAELQVLDRDGGVADFVGDSLGLSRAATTVQAEHIVFCGVKFMAETAKIINPTRTVLIPNAEAGCSLAESINASDVRAMREMHPDAAVMTYINTYAETKAESDVCCTSRNALSIAASLPQQDIVFLPDMHMGRNLRDRIKRETGKNLILWIGTCEVHAQFSGAVMRSMMSGYPDAEALVHWEVPQDAVQASMTNGHGVVGSTTDIINHVASSNAKKFLLVSECDLGATLKGMYPDREFITPCIVCKHMKRITPENTLATLRAIGTSAMKSYDVTLSEDILRRALPPIQRMLDLS